MPTAKGFLEDTRRLAERIRRTREMIEAADSMLGVRGCDPAFERVSGGSRRDRLAESLDRLQGYRDELAGLLDDYIALQRFACSVVDRLPDPRHGQVISMRYLEGREWREIARKTAYSQTQLFRLHRAALASLEAVRAEGETDRHAGR